MNPLIEKARWQGQDLCTDEIAALLEIGHGSDLDELWQAADIVRAETVGHDIWLRGLLEFSNYCRRDCLYCGLRRSNGSMKRFRMTSDEILQAIEVVNESAIGTVVLQSGEDPWWTQDKICQLIGKIKDRFSLAITLSIGWRPRTELAAFRQAGADRFLLRHETANPELYRDFHPDSTLRERVEMLSHLGELGYEVGSGCLIGLPGQTTADLAADIALARELGVDMFGVGPFIPHPDTPLSGCPGGTADMTYKMIAVARLVLRDVLIPVTTALATLDELGRERGWSRGANVVMPSATPAPYRQQYELYQNKRCLEDNLRHCRGCLGRRVAGIGREIGQGAGGTYRQKALGVLPYLNNIYRGGKDENCAERNRTDWQDAPSVLK